MFRNKFRLKNTMLSRVWLQIGLFFCATLSMLSALPCRSEEPHPLDTLRAIRNRAGSIQQFLSNPALTKQYFKVLSQYFNQKIHKNQFEAIIKDLAQLLQDVPEFNDHLSRVSMDPEPIVIATHIRSYAKEFKDRGTPWSDLVTKWRRDLEARAAPYFEILDEASRHDTLTRDLAERLELQQTLHSQRPAFVKRYIQEHQLQDLPRKVQNRRTKAAWHEYVQNEVAKIQSEIDPALSYLMFSYLNLEETADSLRTNADTALDILDRLNKSPEEALTSITWAPPSLLPKAKRYLLESPWQLSGGAGYVPSFETTKEDKTLFEPLTQRVGGKTVEVNPMGPATYVSRISDPFEGIWKGFLIDECTKSDPRRYLVSLMAQAQTFYIEKTYGEDIASSWTHPQGFVLLIPIRHKTTGNMFLSVDFGAPDLGKYALFTKDDEPAKTALAFEWVAYYQNRHPNTRFVLGESTSGDNAGVHRRLHKEWEYVLGKTIGPSADTEPIDRLFMTRIREHTKSTHYSDHFMYDAGLKSAKTLVEPSPFITSRRLNTMIKAATPEETLTLLQQLDKGATLGSLRSQWQTALILHHALVGFLDHEDPKIQNLALRVLMVLPIQTQAFKTRISQAIVAQLAPDSESLATFMLHLSHTKGFQKQNCQTPDIQWAITKLLSHRDVDIRLKAIRTLSGTRALDPAVEKSVQDTLVSWLSTSDPSFQLEFLRGKLSEKPTWQLRWKSSPAVRTALAQLCQDDALETKIAAISNMRFFDLEIPENISRVHNGISSLLQSSDGTGVHRLLSLIKNYHNTYLKRDWFKSPVMHGALVSLVSNHENFDNRVLALELLADPRFGDDALNESVFEVIATELRGSRFFSTRWAWTIAEKETLQSFFKHAIPVHEALSEQLRPDNTAMTEAAFRALTKLSIQRHDIRLRMLRFVDPKDQKACLMVFSPIKTQAWSIETFLPQYYALLRGLNRQKPEKYWDRKEGVTGIQEALWLLVEQNTSLKGFETRILKMFQRQMIHFFRAEYSSEKAEALARFIENNPRFYAILPWFGNDNGVHIWHYAAGIAQALGNIPKKPAKTQDGDFGLERYGFANDTTPNPTEYFREFFALHKASLAALEGPNRLRALIALKNKRYGGFNPVYSLSAKVFGRALLQHKPWSDSGFLAHKWILSEVLDQPPETFASQTILKGLLETFVEFGVHLKFNDRSENYFKNNSHYLTDAFKHLEEALKSSQSFNLPLFQMLCRFIAHKHTTLEPEHGIFLTWLGGQSFQDPKHQHAVVLELQHMLHNLTSTPLPSNPNPRQRADIEQRIRIIQSIGSTLVDFSIAASHKPIIKTIDRAMSARQFPEEFEKDLITMLEMARREIHLKHTRQLDTAPGCD